MRKQNIIIKQPNQGILCAGDVIELRSYVSLRRLTWVYLATVRDRNRKNTLKKLHETRGMDGVIDGTHFDKLRPWHSHNVNNIDLNSLHENQFQRNAIEMRPTVNALRLMNFLNAFVRHAALRVPHLLFGMWACV